VGCCGLSSLTSSSVRPLWLASCACVWFVCVCFRASLSVDRRDRKQIIATREEQLECQLWYCVPMKPCIVCGTIILIFLCSNVACIPPPPFSHSQQYILPIVRPFFYFEFLSCSSIVRDNRAAPSWKCRFKLNATKPQTRSLFHKVVMPDNGLCVKSR